MAHHRPNLFEYDEDGSADQIFATTITPSNGTLGESADVDVPSAADMGYGMKLGDLRRTWEALGETDPFWAILTDPSKKNNRWDPQEFFASGEAEIDCLMDSIAALPVPVKRGAALDFGCGVGRLTQALCRHFERCIGVDIASSMIRLAQEHNRFGDRCQYLVNEAGDLRMFGDGCFDFIYSNIVLQHIPPEYSARYIRDFIRVLSAAGLAVFQVPSHVARSVPPPAADTMFNARITASPQTLAATAGAKIQIVATVKNTSACLWPARSALETKYKFRLGDHWLSATGEIKQMNDSRTDLVKDLEPSEEITLSLTVTAPDKPGEYILELDMVQEHVAWFKDKGSPTCRLSVRVSASPESAGAALTAQPAIARPVSRQTPEIAMYCLHRDTVGDLVTGAGARILQVEEYGSAGSGFVSYRYYVLK